MFLSEFYTSVIAMRIRSLCISEKSGYRYYRDAAQQINSLKTRPPEKSAYCVGIPGVFFVFLFRLNFYHLQDMPFNSN